MEEKRVMMCIIHLLKKFHISNGMTYYAQVIFCFNSLDSGQPLWWGGYTN